MKGEERICIQNDIANNSSMKNWSVDDVRSWLQSHGLFQYEETFAQHEIDGQALLMLTEDDLKEELNMKTLGHVKKFLWALESIQQTKNLSYNPQQCVRSPLLNLPEGDNPFICDMEQIETVDHSSSDYLLEDLYHSDNFQRSSSSISSQTNSTKGCKSPQSPREDIIQLNDSAYKTNWRSKVKTRKFPPEYAKTIVALFYVLFSSWISALVSVFLHTNIPDRKIHPPLPDVFLDNFPYIPWAFKMCEVIMVILIVTFAIVIFFHKHRSIIMRRYAALFGTIYLFRSSTMFVTRLSVPAEHLICSPLDEGDLWTKIKQAFDIWKGIGLSITGVNICGDYMYSGHTISFTLLNFFITEYTPRRMYCLHTGTWILNIFGAFFILAAKEHYTVDVIIAFYITSRLFLYYHSLANTNILRQRDSFRTKIRFPMFSYFEMNVIGILPNEYVNPISRANLRTLWKRVRHCCHFKWNIPFHFIRRSINALFPLSSKRMVH